MKYPKNLCIYTFDPATVAFDELEGRLGALPLSEPGPSDVERTGFVSPFDGSSPALVLTVDRFYGVQLGIRTKVVPPSVVVDETRAELRRRAGGGVHVTGAVRKEVRRIVYDRLLARAFCKSTFLPAWLDRRGVLFVDTPAPAKAETLISRVRDALGSFAVLPLAGEMPLKATASVWLKDGKAPAPFTLGDSCVLSGSDGERWTGNGVELSGMEIDEHLRAGKEVEKVGLRYRDLCRFSVDSKWVLHGLRLADGRGGDDKQGDAGTLALAGSESYAMLCDLAKALRLDGVPGVHDVSAEEA